MALGRWKVEHNCPQCGGPVALTEDERILTCGYCRVKLFVANDGGPLRYCLPPRHADVGSIVMVPYWRVRGQIYRDEDFELTARIVDDTRLACAAPALPPTLGVRPQAMPLRFASAEFTRQFVTPSVEPRFSPVRRTRRPNARVIGDRCFELPLMPARSIVYLPVRLAGGVFDAVGSRRLGALDADDWLPLAGSIDTVPPAVKFLPTLCPWCSWQLDCHPESLVLTCGLCRSAYRAGPAGLQEVAYSVVPGGDWDVSTHVPFWRVRADVAGIDLRSRADLARFSNLPVVVRPEWEREPAEFWVPAFGTTPDQFLRYSRTMTIGRPEALPAGRQFERKPMSEPWPVMLPAPSLPTAVKVLAADLGHPKVTLFPRMDEIEVTVTVADLVYVPLADAGTELAHPDVNLVVQRSALTRTTA
jgi:hypothetical protein